jgi:3-hydroxyisobutyrate dehydrogenase-like beta-hydroxyacid dehydrogenase
MTSVGFAGLGRMGSRMAANVAAAGFELTVWNRTRERADAFVAETGAAVTDSPAELAGKADVVVTMLADEDALRGVYEGDDGLLAGLRGSATAVEMSTVGPPAVHWLRERLAPLGVGLVDAPVSGSTELAAARRLMIMAGGDEADVERVRPVLDAIGSPVLFVGTSGSGATMKLAVNAIVYGLVEAAAEALVLAESAGIDRARAYEVFLSSAVAAPALRYRQEAFVRPGEVPPVFSLELAAKDLRLITGLAEQVSAAMPQAAATLAVMQRAIAAGFGDEDLSGMAQYLREGSE